MEMFMIWKGGLASHGGMIGMMVAAWIFVRMYGRQYRFNYLWLSDRMAIPALLACACIRIGNLMNSEIYGEETSLPWGFIFACHGETVPKHPTQIYEALCYLAFFFLLLWLYRRYLPKLKAGMLLGFTFILGFTARFLLEFIKNPQVGFEDGMTLDMGQWLSIPFILLGIGLLIYACITKTPAMLPQKAPAAPRPDPKPKPEGQALHKDGNRLGKKRRG